MTAELDRAAALGAAVRDIARDLEADLGKLSRFRGVTNGSTSAPSFRDPGADIASYEKQKADFPGRVEHTIDAYRHVLATANRVIGQTTTGTTRIEILGLLTAIQDIRNHDDAAALVATFEEA